MPRRSRSRSPRRRRSHSPPVRRRSDHDRYYEKERERGRRHGSPPSTRRRSYRDDERDREREREREREKERERERPSRREERSPENRRREGRGRDHEVRSHGSGQTKERHDSHHNHSGGGREERGRRGEGGGERRGRREEGGGRWGRRAEGGRGRGRREEGEHQEMWKEKINEIHPSRLTDVSMDVEMDEEGTEKRTDRFRSERFEKTDDSVFEETGQKVAEGEAVKMESEGGEGGGVGRGRRGRWRGEGNDRGSRRELQEQRLLESLTDPRDVPRGTWYFEHDDRSAGTQSGRVQTTRGPPPPRRYSTGDERYRRERGRDREWERDRRWRERRQRSPRVWKHDMFDELERENKEEEEEEEEWGEDEREGGGKWRSVVHRPGEERRHRGRANTMDDKWVHDKFEEHDQLVSYPSQQYRSWQGRTARGREEGRRVPREEEQTDTPMDTRPISLFGFGHSAGVFFLFVGVSFVIYVGMVFIVEVCIPGVFVHRLVDAIVSITFSLLWFLASIIVTVYASKWEVPALGGVAFFGFVLVVLTAASAFFAFRTRMKYGDGRKGSKPILAI